jgi:hypothetical protein
MTSAQDGPYDRIDPVAWEIVTEHCPKPWPREVAIADLEHHRSATHRNVKFPGRPTLCKRWGWTDWKVYSLLVEVDPLGKGQAEANQQPTNSRPTADQQPQHGPTPDIEAKPTADQQPTNSEPTSRDPLLEEEQEVEEGKKETRDPPSGQVHHLVVAPPDPPPPDRLTALWDRLMELLVGSGHGQALDLTDDRRRRLRACVKALDSEQDGADRLAMLWAYWLLGPDPWWRQHFAGGALLAKLLQHQKVDERALSVGDWVWSGRFEAEPEARSRGRPDTQAAYDVLAKLHEEYSREEAS